jgi:hypothetical protein
LTAVYLTIDTEYAAHLPGANGTPGTRAENYARSILCQTPAGAVGIFHQMDVMDAHGIKGIFFVDPMPALLWGVAAIEDVVGPIVARGHDIQLHCHSEWLAHVPGNGLSAHTGRNLKDFGFEDQCRILEYARDTLIAAGAPSPVAFRAGNYGADDDTLRALATLGIGYDSSHCPALAGADCGISLGGNDRRPCMRENVLEVPVDCIETFGGRLRHGQLTALSLRELVAELRHARDSRVAEVVLVSHSFELLSRDRRKINRIVERRFRKLCAAIGTMPGVSSATFAARPPSPSDNLSAAPLLPHHPVRGGARMIEQAIANALYSRGFRIGTQHALALGTVLLT